MAGREDSDRAKQLNLRMLQIFYMQPYAAEEDFYGQFEGRLEGFTDAPGNKQAMEGKRNIDGNG